MLLRLKALGLRFPGLRGSRVGLLPGSLAAGMGRVGLPRLAASSEEELSVANGFPYDPEWLPTVST